MASRVASRLQQILKYKECRRLVHPIPLARSYCSAVNLYNDHDPAPLFFDDKVQSILKRLTGVNLDKVYRTRLFEKRLNVPKYEFLTDEELQEEMEKAKEKANKILQMPPVVKERQPITDVLSTDLALLHHDSAKFIFTDITFGMSDRKRTIVVREIDGTLRHASWEERDRMNQIYNPTPGRKLLKPKMFLEENLKDVISREKYEFVLDRACAQFEPDEPEYQKVCSLTYEAIEEKRKYQMLRSTRHYGPLCFYLVWHRRMDNMLIDLVQQESLSGGADLVQLYHHIHKDSKSSLLNIDSSDHMAFIKAYVEEDSLRQSQLQLAIQRYEDLLLERQQHEETVQSSHGL